MSTSINPDFSSPADALSWLIAMGADEIVANKPIDRFALTEQALAQKASDAPSALLSKPPVKPQAVSTVASDVSNLNSIAEIIQALNYLETHPLRRTATRLSFFEGPENAAIMIVSDRPRNEEDKSGLVFSGKARLLLSNMLAAINLKLEDVGMMNLLPWRPPGNATPKDADVLATVPFAARALQLVGPRLILAFSSLPGQYLAGGDSSIIRQRGKWQEANGIPLLATLHPDELLKHPTQKRQGWRDLQMFKERMG